MGFQPRMAVGAIREVGGVNQFRYQIKAVPTGFPGVSGTVGGDRMFLARGELQVLCNVLFSLCSVI